MISQHEMQQDAQMLRALTRIAVAAERIAATLEHVVLVTPDEDLPVKVTQ
jgi:hypothetical protein